MTTNRILHLHLKDNVGIANRKLDKGEVVIAGEQEIKCSSDIQLGHKVSLGSIEQGEPVFKYGQTIGFSTKKIQPGDWIHSHNLAMGDIQQDYAIGSEIPEAPTPIVGRTFNGYRRGNGKVGTRNYVAVISTVNCSASVSKYVARKFDAAALAEYENIDGVFAVTHNSGCGMPFKLMGHDMLNRALGGFARHPNIGGYLIIGLGCEQASAGILIQDQGLVQIKGSETSQSGPPVFVMQDVGGTAKTVDAAVAEINRILPQANNVQREAISAEEIILGTECGGSDGNSGITANPAVGFASDQLVACGGTAILAETSEIYGAEQLLTRRSVNKSVANKLLERIEWWKGYVKMFGAELDNNPSIGNKAGGLTTIAEKSLGAVAKGGTTALRAVYEYAEPVTEKGFVVMDTPGFDPPSVTGMVAGGANVVAFTTGRGSCFGCKPVPSIKIATNTNMYEKLVDDMDINAGTMLEGESLQSVGIRIFEEILEVASGKKTKSELHGIGDEEFIPWVVGPIL